MELVSYALFDDAEAARQAIDAVNANSDAHHHYDVVVHQGRLDMSSMDFFETDAREASREGAVAGAVLGALAGLVVFGPIGLAGGAALGVFYGGIAGALGGVAAPDRRLKKLSAELASGKLLVVVGSPDVAHRDQADDILLASGGRVEHKPFY
jgi:uncharacterized membrane protein